MGRRFQCKLQKEFYRRKFVKRAKKQKKRYFSAMFKEKQIDKTARRKLAFRRISSFCFWFGLGVLVLIASWELFWRTGESTFSTKPFLANEEDIKVKQEEESGINQQDDGWTREFFGVEIRIQDGKIVFFKEKDEKIPLQ